MYVRGLTAFSWVFVLVFSHRMTRRVTVQVPSVLEGFVGVFVSSRWGFSFSYELRTRGTTVWQRRCTDGFRWRVSVACSYD